MLERIIHGMIAERGSITVREYMELALTHPEYGYYKSRDPLGCGGDFTTAPEISQIFGELIGLWCIEAWRLMGEPAPCSLVELGPGRGTLMSDLLRTSKMRLKFYESLSLHLVETSPLLKAVQVKNLETVLLPKLWHDTADSLPAQPAIFIANEFFDALPIRQFVRVNDGEKKVGEEAGEVERCVTVNERGEMCFTPAGEVVREESPAALEVMQTICRHIKRFGGVALIVDYGYCEGEGGDSLQAVREHQHHPVLTMPGEADITAHVDFMRLSEVAASEGLRVFSPQPQGVFLRMLGGDILLEKLLLKAKPEQQEQLYTGYRRLVDDNAMGVLFKVMTVTTRNITRLAGW